MHRTMNLWVLVCVSACLVIGFFVYNVGLSQSISEQDARYEASKQRLTSLQNRKSELDNMLEIAGTDAFVENQARTLYGYMMPDEIRFVISNPEALYGDEGVPSR